MTQGQPTKVKKKKKSVLKRAAQARQHVHAHANATSTPTGMNPANSFHEKADPCQISRKSHPKFTEKSPQVY